MLMLVPQPRPPCVQRREILRKKKLERQLDAFGTLRHFKRQVCDLGMSRACMLGTCTLSVYAADVSVMITGVSNAHDVDTSGTCAKTGAAPAHTDVFCRKLSRTGHV